MQVHIAALENACNYLLKQLEKDEIKYALVSYFYLKENEFQIIVDSVSKKLLIDSGAHSFQHGKKIDFVEYTKKYAEFIKKNTDNPKIEGFFEMDIDNVIGYEKVLELRKILEEVSDKIIPV